MIQTRQLYHFLVVSELGSLSAAARKIGVTQPALTRSIKQLENRLEVSLLERSPLGVFLTPNGMILARRVRLMNNEYQHAIAEIHDRDKGITGRLNISAGPVWITHFLPPVLKAYYDQYPEVQVKVTQGQFASQHESLLSGDSDLICGMLDFPDHPEIEKEHLLDLRYTVFAREGHPLSAVGKASAKQLASFPWVVLADEAIGSTRIEAFFEAHGIKPPRIAAEMSTLGCLSMVRNSDFLTNFAEQGASTLSEFGLVKINHDGNFWEFPSGIARRRAGDPSPALRAFHGLVLSSIDKSCAPDK